MSVDFTPDFADYTGVGAFKWWAQSVIPLVYDDSLSYYEVLCKVTDYLNKVIQDLSATETNVDALRQAYDQLQGYVNDYFDNLDVQDEINDKLDRMVIDGTIAGIVAPIAQAYSAPVFVDAVNKMTDPTKNYVLTTNGHIYIWNGNNRVDSGMVYDINGLTFIYRNTFTTRRYNIDSLTESGFYFYTNGINATGLDYTRFSIGFVCLYGDGTGNLKATINDVNGNMAFGNNEGSAGSWTWNYHLAVDDTLTVAGAPGDAATIGNKFTNLFLTNPIINPMLITKFRTSDLADERNWQIQSMCYNEDTVYLFFSCPNTDGLTKCVITDFTFTIPTDPNKIMTLYAGHANSCFYNNGIITIVSGGVLGENPWPSEPQNVVVEWDVSNNTTTKRYLAEMETIYWIHPYGEFIFASDGSHIFKYTNNYEYVSRSKYIGKSLVAEKYGVQGEEISAQQGIIYNGIIITNYFIPGNTFVRNSQNTDYFILAFWDMNFNLINTSMHTVGIRQEIEGMFVKNNTLYLSFYGPTNGFYKTFLAGFNTSEYIDSFYQDRSGDLNNMWGTSYFNSSNMANISNLPELMTTNDARLDVRDVGDNQIMQILSRVATTKMPSFAFRGISRSSNAINEWRYLLDNTMATPLNSNNRPLGIDINSIRTPGIYPVYNDIINKPYANRAILIVIDYGDNTRVKQIIFDIDHQYNVYYRTITGETINQWQTLQFAVPNASSIGTLFDNNMLNAYAFSIIDTVSWSQFTNGVIADNGIYCTFKDSASAAKQIVLPIHGKPMFRRINYNTKEVIANWTVLGNSIRNTINLIAGSNDINIVTVPNNYGVLSFALTYALKINGADIYGKAEIYGSATTNISNFIQNHTPVLSHENYTVTFITSGMNIVMRINSTVAAENSTVSITMPDFMIYNQ